MTDTTPTPTSAISRGALSVAALPGAARTIGATRAGLALAILVALIALSVAGCQRDDAAQAAPANAPVLIGPENITVVKADEIRTGPAISGTLEPEQEATVRAQIGGAVLQTLVEQGQRVSRGQLLARIDDAAIRDQVLSARSAVTTAQSTVENAERELQRTEALLTAGAIAERNLEQARWTATNARSQLADARARLANAEKQVENTRIVSPMDGIVSARAVNAGDVVSPGGAIATVVDPASMRLEASVPSEQLSAVRVGSPVDFTVNGYPTRHFVGRVTRINPVADPATRQVRILVSLPNQGGTLVGGLFADGRVSSETHTAPVVPTAAVDERGVRPTVMRVKAGRVERAEVTLGIRDAASETVEVTAGLQPGDTVLVGAARGISAGTPVRVSAPTDVTK